VRKCHADVAAEFQSSSNYHPPGATYPVWEACVLCHQVEPLYPGDVNYAEQKHAATIVPCDYCHWPEANAFEQDPHYEFILVAEDDPMFPGATEACVACHTHARLDISFEWMKYMTFEFKVKNPDKGRDYEQSGWNAADLWENVAHYGYNGTDFGTGFNAHSYDYHYVFDYGAYIDSDGDGAADADYETPPR
jgi:hypothetical protein